MLPLSLKELRLVGGSIPGQINFHGIPLVEMKALARWPLDHLTKFLDRLPDMKDECLPNLLKIDCEGAHHEDYEQSGSYQQIREACTRAEGALNELDPDLCHVPWECWPLRGAPAPRMAGWWVSWYQMDSPDPS